MATSERKTEALCDADVALRKGAYFMPNVKRKIDIPFDKSLSIVINIDEYRKGYKKIKGRGGKIRLPYEIRGENLNYCKQLTTLVNEFQHIIGINGSVMNNGS